MSTTTKTTEKIILEFDQRGFEYASAMFNEKNNLIKSIQQVAKNELDLIIEISDSKTLKENIYNAIEKKFKVQNTLNLTGEKLAELMQLNLKPIFEASRLLVSYDEIDKNTTPTKEMFTISVENEKETERYNHALKLIETINKTRSLTNELPALNMYLIVFKSVIRLDGTGNNFEPSPMFVKGIF